VCPDGELRLECTVVEGANTVWKGTAFDCSTSNDEIALRHSQFESGIVGECNNGMIMGRNLNRMFDGPNSTFTSQLVIHLPLLNAAGNTLDGTTVECIHDNGHREINIGTHVIAYMRKGTYIM
jgi:hypothetical protein